MDENIIENHRIFLSNSSYFFHLAANHPNLPFFELNNIFEGEEFKFKIIEKQQQCVIVECTNDAAYRVANRASYCKRVVRLLIKEKIPEENLIEKIAKKIRSNIDFSNIVLPNDTFCVRVYKVIKNMYKKESLLLESKIGKIIYQALNQQNKVNLKNPKISFVLLLTDQEYLFGTELFARESGYFLNREPGKRPFFKPGTLEPRFARLMANLSKIGSKKILLDPFCGPGGILVEASIMNCNVIGTDIDRKMILGAKKNIKHYSKNKNYELLLADARSLPFDNTINCIATDPPYGKSTSTYGNQIKELLSQFLNETRDVLSMNGIIAIGITSETPLKEIIEDEGYKLEMLEEIYIHKSLTRKIGVCMKI